MPIEGQRVEVKKDEFAHEKAMAQAIVTALGEFLTARTSDLPHRFKAPAAFAQYLSDWGVNQSYHSQPIYSNSTSNYMTLEMTTRPSQKIFEIVFQGADGMRLFTLEIEYGDAIYQKREVLLSWRQAIYKKTDHRNPPCKETTKASSFLSEFRGLFWRKILPRHGAELTQVIRNQNQ